MKVLLLDDVTKLGKKGDVKDVKDGYALNYLIPHKLANKATRPIIKMWEKRLKKEQKLIKEREKLLVKMQKNISSAVVSIKKKLGESGSLYGSVTKDEIVISLKEQHSLTLDKRDIKIDSTIKTTGLFDVAVNLGDGVYANLKVDVAGE